MERLTLFTKEKLTLSSGATLGPIDIAYESYGTLNKKKDNAILICHALSGDAMANVWWEFLIGPGKAIDTERYFVICSNVLGSCYGSTGPASINPETGTPYGLSFPIITIEDMVNAQRALIEALEIKQLKFVLGGSMGGMQAMQWAISHSDIVQAVGILAAATQLTPQGLAFNTVGREAILSDPNWNNGKYTAEKLPSHGLSVARMIGHITYRSNQSMGIKFGRKLQLKEDYGYDLSTDFAIESYLKYQGDKFVSRFDANSYIYLSKAMSYFDLSKTYGSVETAFKNADCRFLVSAISSDWLYPAEESKSLVRALMKLNKEVTYAEIQAEHGHDSFLIENPQIIDLIGNFIENLKS